MSQHGGNEGDRSGHLVKLPPCQNQYISSITTAIRRSARASTESSPVMGQTKSVSSSNDKQYSCIPQKQNYQANWFVMSSCQPLAWITSHTMRNWCISCLKSSSGGKDEGYEFLPEDCQVQLQIDVGLFMILACEVVLSSSDYTAASI